MDANYQRRADKRPLDLIQNNESLVEIQQDEPSTELKFYLNHNWQLVYNLDAPSAEPSAISNSSENQATRQPIETPVQHVSHPVPQPQPCSQLILYGQVRRQQPCWFPSSSMQQVLPRGPQQRHPYAHVRQYLTPSFPLRPRSCLSRAYPPGALRDNLYYKNSLDFSSSEAVPSLNQTRTTQKALHEQLRQVMAQAPQEQAGQQRMSTLDRQNMLPLQPEVLQNMSGLINKNSLDASSSGAAPSLKHARRNREVKHETQLPQVLALGPLEQAGRLRRSTLDRQMLPQQSRVPPQNMSAAGSARGRRRLKDPGWKYAKIVQRDQQTLIKCNLCGKECCNSITRMKRHLAGISTDITACPLVPAQVRQEMRNAVSPAPPRIPSSRRVRRA